MKFGSLFAGIGGLDLGLERAGMECRWQVEIDEWCRRVLAKHWPDVPRYADIRDIGDELEPVDLICGGFPCQPFSLAGRRRGTADERWMWPEFERVVRLLRPRYVLLENVPGLLAGDGMAEVLGDLATLGFGAEWECIPAAAVGAPHLRWRVFIVAYRNRRGRQGIRESGLLDGERSAQRNDADGRNRALADAERQPGALRPAEGERLGRSAGSGDPLADDADSNERHRRTVINQVGWRRSTRATAKDGHSGGAQWSSEPDVGRVANGVPARVDRLRGLGNAVVPQVAEAVGRMIAEHARR